MLAKPLLLIYLLTLPLWLGSWERAQAQAVSELPRTEYYVARELFRVGRTLEASEGFKAAFNRGRRVGEQRWIDSIPPLVMLGECYYQQGSLPAAMEQYDAALTLALAYPAWIDQIELPPEPLPELDYANKGINWFAPSRPTRSVVVEDGIQISLDPTQAQLGPQGEVIAPVSLVTRLDATEVLRTMGIALMRRWQILGPLAQHSKMTGELDMLFARNSAQQATWVGASWNVLRGIHSLASPQGIDAAQLLRSGTLINNQFDYYLSPLSMLVLGELEAREGNYQAAIVSWQDAALLAGQFEQYDILAEAIDGLSAAATINRRGDLTDALQRLAVWANKKSGSVQAAALVGAAELSTYAGNAVAADKLIKQAGGLLQSREMSLPRQQAQLAYVSALFAFQQKRGTLGFANLETALKFMRGTAKSGAVVESIFQTQMTLDLLAAGNLTAADAESILLTTLAEPNKLAWELAPLKTLASITTTRLPAFERLLELSVARNGADDELLERIDRLQRQRFYEAIALGGRLFAWRHALNVDPAQLSAENRQLVDAARQQSPELVSAAARIDVLVEKLRQGPLPLDDRKLPADSKRDYQELQDVSLSFENQLAFQSLQRSPLARSLPGAASLPQLKQRLASGDLMLGMVTTNQMIVGVAITQDATHFWQVANVEAVNVQLSNLLLEIGLVRQTPLRLPSEVTQPSAAWRAAATNLYAALFPAEVQAMLQSSQRVILAPSARLWYIPYELLPTTSQPGADSWLAGRAVTYVPTLGSLGLAFGSPPAIKDTLAVVGSFFSLDRESNQQQAESVLQAIPNSQALFLNQKLSIPSVAWLKLRTDQLWVAQEVDSRGGWEANVLPLDNSRQSQLSSWLETPQASPKRVILPGFQTGLASGKLQQGNEIFLPICSMMFSGTQAACLSRWPVGGESTSTFLQRYLEELQVESPAQALRRSVLAQWTEQFLIADEPALLPAGKEAAALSSGSHPLLWGGYMAVGDYQIQP